MGRGAAFGLCLVAALAGGAAALAIGRSAGWLDKSTSTVVVERPAGSGVAPVVAATPLTGKGFVPAQIYRLRSPGVVTILSYFDAPDTATSAGQGSGFVVSKSGYILTSAHVVTTAGQTATLHRARDLYIEFDDADRISAKLVGYDL